ncbi:MAG: DNA polymerase III subunit gamma/tau [Gammaproteobacteria bacterium]|nr:DNA polymerase III subunit gamma/tau [Gammaproteobacteria bacterium]
MSYQVLARKWRPKNFTEIVEQKHVTQALINALDQQRLHHAYLFTGTRGVGKTTLARILAKCLNCEEGISSTPCGKCSACQEIDQGRFIDLIEVDAASRTKVEDTRELLDNVQYAPTRGRYKVYLIDEVHMLSGHSFNALLKTLEEPPEHVKFLLATTDPQKLPVTVLSRCLQFNLKNIAAEKIAEHLITVLKKEQITYEEAALAQLARAANGSIRDGLSLLDQAIAFANSNITTQQISAMLGSIEDIHLYELATALSQDNGATILTTINTMAEQGVDFNIVLEELLSLLHHLTLLQMVPTSFQESWGKKDKLEELVKAFTPEQLQLFYQIALIGRRDLPLAPTAKNGFEMVMLRMLAFDPGSTTNKVEHNPSQSEHNPSNPASHPRHPVLDTGSKNKRSAQSSEQTVDSAVKPRNDNSIQRNNDAKQLQLQQIATGNPNWPALLAQLSLTPSTKALAANCSLKQISGNHYDLVLSAQHAPMMNKNHEERLSTALSEHLKKPTRATISTITAEVESPAAIVKREQRAKQQQAEEKINSDNHVQTLVSEFNATIIPGSIKNSEER